MSTHNVTGRTKAADETPQEQGSNRLQKSDERTDDQGSRDEDEAGGGQVSESGGAALNEETAEGGADAVPDSADVNR